MVPSLNIANTLGIHVQRIQRRRGGHEKAVAMQAAKAHIRAEASGTRGLGWKSVKVGFSLLLILRFGLTDSSKVRLQTG